MNSRSKNFQIFLILGLMLVLFFNLSYKSKYNLQKDSKYPKTYHKSVIQKSSSWNVNPISIDDLDPSKNWSYTASYYAWCYGSGTWEDPYIIENITIDGNRNPFCIKIENSNVYFFIKNCTFYNSGWENENAGIKLINTNNSFIVSNNMSFNGRDGLLALRCNNLTISDNIATNNYYYTGWEDPYAGIRLIDTTNSFIVSNNMSFNGKVGFWALRCNNLTISNNLANNNNCSAIQLTNCTFINVKLNQLENQLDGIWLSNSTACTIFNNSIINNTSGIFLNFYCKYVNVSYNNLENNRVSINLISSDYSLISHNSIFVEPGKPYETWGFLLTYSNYNNITHNSIIGVIYCFKEYNCVGNLFLDNYCEQSFYISPYTLVNIIRIIPPFSFLYALIQYLIYKRYKTPKLGKITNVILVLIGILSMICNVLGIIWANPQGIWSTGFVLSIAFYLYMPFSFGLISYGIYRFIRNTSKKKSNKKN